MAKLRIPEQYKGGVEKLASLPVAPIDDLLAVLNQQQPLLRPPAFIARVASKVSEMRPQDAESIVDALFSLFAARDFFDLSFDDFVEAIGQDSNLNVSGGDRGQLQERARLFLTLPSIEITMKAATLLNEAERRFHDARIVTDIRPIFQENAQDEPSAAIILHTLRLRYHHNYDGKLADVYISLDENDAQELQAVLQRADQKALSLVGTLRDSKMLHVTFDEE